MKPLCIYSKVEQDGVDSVDLFTTVQNIYLKLRMLPLVLEFKPAHLQGANHKHEFLTIALL